MPWEGSHAYVQTTNVTVQYTQEGLNNLGGSPTGGGMNWGGALAGAFSGLFSVTSDHQFKYGQRINGTVVSRTELSASYKATSLKAAGILGRVSNVLAAGSILYDFGSGNANTSTLIDAGLLIGGVTAAAIFGTAAAPVLGVIGLGYGAATLMGFDNWINEQLNIRDKINFTGP